MQPNLEACALNNLKLALPEQSRLAVAIGRRDSRHQRGRRVDYVGQFFGVELQQRGHGSGDAAFAHLIGDCTQQDGGQFAQQTQCPAAVGQPCIATHEPLRRSSFV